MGYVLVFAAFVKATGYITVAEQKPTKEEFPDAPEENLIAGSVIFTPTAAAVNLNDFLQWWSYIGGTDWKHPQGPESSIKGKEKYPGLRWRNGTGTAIFISRSLYAGFCCLSERIYSDTKRYCIF